MDELLNLIKVCHWMSEQNYSPATSGNYSVRSDSNHLYISASGIEKGRIGVDDFLKMNLDGSFEQSDLKPSDESLIHAKILERDKSANCVLHSHSIASTALSVLTLSGAISFEGFEMQKAFANINSHLDKLSIPIIENTQDISKLAAELDQRWTEDFLKVPCFFIRGHGLYVWGKTVKEAKRHLEGIEFLVSVKLELLKAGLK